MQNNLVFNFTKQILLKALKINSLKSCIFLLAVLFQTFEAKSQYINSICQDSNIAIVATQRPSCFGSNDGSLAIQINTGNLNPPYLITLLAGSNPFLSNVPLDASGVDTLFNLPSTITSIVYSGFNSNNQPISVTCFTDLADPPRIQPTALLFGAIQCYSETADSLAVSATNGVAPFSFVWRPGQNTGHIANTNTAGNTGISLPADTYTIVVEDANTCLDSVAFEITQPDSLIAQVGAIGNVLCKINPSGSISLNVVGGTPFNVGNAYNFAWSNGLPNASSQSNLSGGEYFVTVSDSLGCLDSVLSINVVEPDSNLIIDILNKTNVSCLGGNNGNAKIAVLGGVAQYQISWSTGQNVDSIGNLSVGTYYVTASDANNCTAIDSVLIEEPNSSLSSTLLNSVNILCRGQSTGVLSWGASGGTGPYSFNWSHSVQASGATLSNLAAGTYIVTIEDINGCSTTDTASLTEPGTSVTIQNVLTQHVNTCFGDTSGEVAVRIINGSSPYAVNWPFGALTAVINSGDTVSRGFPGGNFQISVVDNQGCNASLNVTINQPDSIRLTTSAVSTNCLGDSSGSVSVIASGGSTPGNYVYLWNDVNSSTTNSVLGLPSGTYTVTVSDNSGICPSKTASAVVGQPSAPLDISLVSFTQVSCEGVNDGTAVVIVSGGTAPYQNIQWSAGNPPVSGNNNQRINLPFGENFAAITDNSGCTDTAIFFVTEPIKLDASVSIANLVSCNDGNDGSLTISGINGTTPYNFNWDRIDAPLSGAENYSANLNQVFGLNPGEYVGIIVDNRGCTARDTLILDNPSVISINFVDSTLVSCFGGNNGSATASATGGRTEPNYNFLWENNQNGTILSNVSAGTYSVTVTDSNGLCPVEDSITIRQNEQITGSFIVDSLPDCGLANGGISVTNVQGGVPFNNNIYTYSWVFDTNNTSNSLSGIIQGTYEVVVTDSLNCSETLSFNLSNINAPSIDSSSLLNPTCFGSNDGSITLVASGQNPLIFSWTGNVPVGQENNLSLDSLSAGNYILQITDALGCSRNEDYTLTEPDSIVLTLNRINILCFGETNGQASVNVSGGIGQFDFLWSSGTNQNTNQVQGLSAGFVSVIVSDLSSNVACEAVDSVEIIEPLPLTLTTIDSLDNNCFGESRGQFRVLPSGGTAPYNFVINPTPTFGGFVGDTIFADQLNAGIYVLNVSDSSSCSESVQFHLKDPSPLFENQAASLTQPVCIGDSSGSIGLNISGGTLPYTFNWTPNFIGNVALAENLPEGNYEAQILDANNCELNVFNSLASASPLSVALIGTQNIFCKGDADGSAEISVSGGTGTYVNYDWSPGITVSASFLEGSDIDTGTYRVIVTDNIGCNDSVSFTITEPAEELSAIISAKTQSLCPFGINGSSATVGPSGGTPPYTYTWSSGTSLNDTVRVNLNSGAFSVSVQDAFGCLVVVNDTLENTDTLNVQVSTVEPGCGASNGSVAISAISGGGGTGGYNFSWFDENNINIGNFPSISNSLTAGNYYVVITPNGCGSDTFQVSLNNNTGPIITLDSLKTPTCRDDEDAFVALNISSSIPTTFTYGWRRSPQTAIIATTDSLLNVGAGEYSIAVTDTTGCVRIENFTITNPAGTTVISNVNQISCNNANDGIIAIEYTGGTLPYDPVVWTGPGGFTSNLDTISPLSEGLYEVLIVDAQNCSTSNSFQINNPALLEASLISSTNVLCNGENTGGFTIGASGGTGIKQYTFPNLGPNFSIVNDTLVYNNVVAGNFMVSITDANNCSNSVPVNISEPLALNATISQQSLVQCFGEQNGFIEINTAGGNSPYQYFWTGGNPIPNPNSNTNNTLSAGNASVLVQDSNGCQQNILFSIGQATSSLQVSSSIIDSVNCFGANTGEAQVNIVGGLPFNNAANYTIQWLSVGNQQVVSNGLLAQNLLASTYEVVVTDSANCERRDTVTINQPDNFSFTFTADSADCGDTNGLAEVFVSGGTPNQVAPQYGITWLNSSNQLINRTGNIANNIRSGAYRIEVIDNLGCIDTIGSINVPDIGGANIIIDSLEQPSCFGFSDGYIRVSTTGNPPFRYLWQTGNNTDTLAFLENIPAGSYSVEVVDVDTCVAFFNFTLVDPSPLQIDSLIFQNASCNGDDNGFAEIFVSGNSGNYNFNWSSGENSSRIDTLVSGSYLVTVSIIENALCFVDDSIFISEPSVLNASLTGTIPNCGQSNGSIQASISGGNVGGFTYEWINLQTNLNIGASQNLSNVASGNYQFTATDTLGCTSNSPSFLLTDLTPPTFNLVSRNDVLCNGANNGRIQLGTTQSDIAYSWSNGANGSLANNLSPGAYSVTITDTISLCSTIYLDTISEPSPLNLSISGNNITCPNGNDGTVNAQIIGGTSPYQFTWSSSAIGNNSQANNLSSGTYYLTVSDANNCLINDSITLIQPANFSANINEIPSNCGANDGELEVTSISGGTVFAGFHTYQWLDASFNVLAGPNNPAINNLSPAIYMLAVADSVNCRDTLATTLNDIGGPLIATLNIVDAGCGASCNGSISLDTTGSNGLTYLWSSGETTSSILGKCSGDYFVTVTDNNLTPACSSVSIINVPSGGGSAFSLQLINSPKCFGENNASAEVVFQTPPTNIAYLWSNGEITQTASNLSGGMNSVTVTDIISGCSSSDSVFINQPNAISLSNISTNQPACGDSTGTISVQAIGGVGNFSYSWQNGLLGQSINNIPAGFYNVTVTDDSLCQNNFLITLSNIGNNVVITKSFTAPLCANSSDGSASISVISGSPPIQIRWIENSTGNVLGLGASINNISAGIYDIEVNASGCIYADSILIQGPSAISASFTRALPNCGIADGSITVSPIGGSAPYAFTWFDQNLALLNPQPLNNVATNLGSGNYTIEIEDLNNCTSQVNYNLVDSGAPAISVLNLTNPSCGGVSNGSIEIGVNSSLPVTITWLAINQNTNLVSNLPSGTYTVEVEDTANCFATQNFTLVNQYSLNGQTQILSAPTCVNTANASAVASALNGFGPYSYLWSNLETGDTANSLNSGINYVTIQDANACLFLDTVNVGSVAAFTLDSVILSAPSCGICDGSIDVYANGGNPNFIFDWNNGSFNGASISGLCADLYELSLDDGNGCTASFLIPLSSEGSNNPAANLSQTPSSCFGNCDAQVSVLAFSQGSGSLGYNWPQLSSTNQAVSDICPGTYGVIVTDSGNLCVLVDTITAIEPNELQISTNVTLPNCNQADGTISLNVSGGTPGTSGYSVLWLNEDTIPLIPIQTGLVLNNIGAGIYFANIQDGNACNELIKVVLNNIGAPAVTLTSLLNPTCTGLCDGAVNITSTSSGLTYNWSNQTTSQNLANVCAGTYQVTVEDALGCLSFEDYSLLNQSIFSAQVNIISDPTCSYTNNGSANVFTSSGTAPYQYLWSSGEVSDTAIALLGNNNVVVVTDAAGCTVDVPIHFNVPDKIEIENLVLQNPLCGQCDGSISLDAIGGTGILNTFWNNGEISTNLGNLCAAAYELNVVDSLGCTQQFIIPLSTQGAPVIQANIFDPNCANSCDGVINLTTVLGTPNMIFNWPQLGTQGIAVDSLCGGLYYYEVTDTAGCVAVDTLSINAPSEITASFAVTEPLCGNSDGEIIAFANGGSALSGIYSYSWTNASGLAIGSDTSSINNLLAGVYFLEIIDDNQCSETFQINLSNENGPEISRATIKNAACQGVCDGEIELTVNHNIPYTINWLPNNENTLSISNLCQGLYEVVITDTNFCVSFDNFEILAPAGFTAFIASKFDASCANSNDGRISLGLSLGNYTFNWEDDFGYSSANQNVNSLFQGTYYLTVSNDQGCVFNETVVLNAQTEILVEAFGDTILCEQPDFLIIGASISGRFNAVSFEWLDNVGKPISNRSRAAIIPPPGNSNFFFSASTENNCLATDNVRIQIASLGTLNLGRSREIVAGDEITLGGSPTASFEANFQWSPTESLNNPNSPNPQAKPLTNTLYTLTATNSDGCVISDSLLIIVLDALTVNNAFSPNGDGVNELWELDFLLEYPNAEVIVFNRWGQTIFRSVGYAQPWDGTFDGEQLPIGTYYYIINLNDNTQNFEPITGTVTIIK